MMEYFELDKRKNFDKRKYLSTELLDKLGVNKYRKLIEENDAIYCSGKYGYKLKNETYEKIKEMKSDFGFHKEFINVLINDKEVLDFFYDLVKMGFWPKLVAKWIAGPISAYMTANAVAISELKIDKEQLISFFKLAEEGKLIENQLKILMDELLNQWGDLQEIIKEKWFDAPAVSEDEITEVAKWVLDANPQIVEQYKGGKVTVIGFFVGQVMKQTQWKANPKQIQEIMTRLLSA